jgi:hypothetical protein
MPKKTQAYEKFIRELEKRMADMGDYSDEKLKNMVQTTHEYLEAASDLTKDEVSLIAEAVRQDLSQWRKEYSDAWQESPSANLFTDSVWHWLVKLSDTTQIEWQEISDEIRHRGVYQSGEYIGLGELECSDCGARIQVWHPQAIEPCAKCGHSYFYRHALRCD